MSIVIYLFTVVIHLSSTSCLSIIHFSKINRRNYLQIRLGNSFIL